MKTKTTVNWKKRFLIPGAITAFALVAAPVVMYDVTGDMGGAISTAYAAEEGGKGKGYRGKRDATGNTGSPRGRRTLDDVLSAAAEGGEDSDRPPHAGTPGSEGKPGGGNAGVNTKKGGDYGDLWIILRDDNGVPILSDDGFVQPLDVDGNLIPLDEEGHPIDASLTQEVEFGRLNIARAPSSVLEHSLLEAVTKLDGLVITAANLEANIDTAGRLIVDGLTIDSPLENLAIYQALLNTDVVDGNIVISVTSSHDGNTDTYTLTVSEDVAMMLAASAFAAASDKTGDLTVDEVTYISGFMSADITASVDTFTYDRDATYGDETVWVLVETSPGIFEPQLVDIVDVVTFNTIPAIDDDGNGIDTFTQAADDALQVIEYVHDNGLN